MHARISRRTAVVLTLVAAVATALVAATVGSSAVEKAPPPVPAKLKADISAVAGLKDPSARDAKLAQLAEAEGGQVNVYTSLSSLIVKAVQKQWATDYPNIKLNLFRGSSEDVTARVMAERKANPDNGADVIETNGTNMLIFQHKKNVLVPYQLSPYATVIPKKYRFDTFTSDRLEEFVVAWNTNLVSSPPRSFKELATSKWAGKLSVEPTDVDWFAQLYEYFTTQAKPKMTTAQADAMFAGILRNAQLTNGHTNQATLLAAGQFSVVVSGHAQSLEQLMAKKAPIAFGPPFVLPVIERPQGVGLAYRLPHPAAALLFYDWLISSKGAQPVLLANGVQPSNPYAGQDDAFKSKPLTIEMDLRPIVAHYAQWEKKYESFTRLGKS